LGQDCDAAMRFGFDTYPTRIYSLNDMTNFLNKYSKYKISFSHNTFKSFYYLEQLKKNVQLNVEGDFKIFEIGAGLFNFGHLLSYELNKFEYVICDLSELILCAHKQITEIYLPQLSGNYNVYLPNELDLFDKCKSQRKVLFITPEQLDKGVLGHDRKFDLFINHESFSEMNIDIVNKYLRYVSILMKKGSIINLVNRHTRPQAKLDEEFKLLSIEEITCFEDYELSFCDVITKQVCTFRAQIPVQQTLPNIFFIGKINQ
jgi:putative sugar O-methyltransferase